MPDVSIIIPVYNSLGFIDACLDSLLAQTMDSIELVFVDDHGTDGTISHLMERMTEYNGPKSIRIISTPKNSGPGAARNLGISEVKGEYIAFVDSDDTVDPDFCAALYEAVRKTGKDLACCDIEMDGRISYNTHTEDKRAFLRHFVSFFTTFIYRRTMIVDQGILFLPSHSAEDTCFLTCCILSSNGIAKVDAPMYHYRLHEGSVTSRRDRSRAAARLSSILQIRRFAKEKGFYRTYRHEIDFLVLKKGWMLALRDLLKG